MEPVAKFVEHTSFPPRLTAEPSDERFDVARTELDLDDPTLERARRAAEAHPEVQAAIRSRFVVITMGADVPAKEGDRTATEVTVGIEFFSYETLTAVRVAVVGDKVASVTKMEPNYRPHETPEELRRAVELITADESRAKKIRDTEPEGLLTPCEASVRCVYMQFVRDGLIKFSATVDLINGIVFDEVDDPDGTTDTQTQSAPQRPTRGRRP
jgi:hypothetical protein